MQTEQQIKEKYIAYIRVSTERQGKSGLGLEAQKNAIQAFLKDASPLETYTDIESGKQARRPELLQAIKACKKRRATLLVAKLDRLSRDVAFIFTLQKEGIKFTCADFPHFNTLTLGIFASLAQYEREIISKRTRDALQAKKAQGKKLGNPRLKSTKKAMERASRKAKKAKARKDNKEALAFIKEKYGHRVSVNYSVISRALTRKGILAPRGGNYSPQATRRLCITLGM